MYKVIVVFVYLACLGYARRVHKSVEQLQGRHLAESELLSKLLGSVRRARSFTVDSVPVRGSSSDAEESRFGRTLQSKIFAILLMALNPVVAFTFFHPEKFLTVSKPTVARSRLVCLRKGRTKRERDMANLASQAEDADLTVSLSRSSGEMLGLRTRHKRKGSTSKLESSNLLHARNWELAKAAKALELAKSMADSKTAALERRQRTRGTVAKGELLQALEARREVLTLGLVAECGEEAERSRERLTEWPRSRLIREGYACVGLTASREPGLLYMDVGVRFAPADGQDLPFHKFGSGELVRVRLDSGEEGSVVQGEELEGMIVDRTKRYLRVALPEERVLAVEREGKSAQWRLDMTTNVVSYQRKAEALTALASPRGFAVPAKFANNNDLWSPLQRALAALPTRKQTPREVAEWPAAWVGANVARSKAMQLTKLLKLNKSQRDAIQAALARTLTLWQGPPGTGKTTTACALMGATVEGAAASGVTGPKVLASSASNIAVDNMLMGLLKLPNPPRVLRIGAPARITAELRNHTLEERLSRHPLAANASRLRRRAAELGPCKQSKRLREQARQIERKASLSIIAKADILLATCVEAGSGLLSGFEFCLCVVDEATQASEPEVLCALSKSHAAVLVGDPAQLPPTVLSEAALSAGLHVSLFERIASQGVDPILLDTQYRMHPGLAEFPSGAFYNDQLKSHPKPADRQPLVGLRWPSRKVPAAFIQSDGGEHKTPGKHSSYSNADEAAAVVDIVEGLLAGGAISSLDDLGIATPYAGQVRLLHEHFSKRGYATSVAESVDSSSSDSGEPRAGEGEAGRLAGTLEIRSVDGYQGREKEVMVLSAVRANDPGNLGFVADPRRLNVAITRARRGLVVVGDAHTLQNDPTWRDWLQWLNSKGAVTTLSKLLDPVSAGTTS